jgi:hypothetical protein
VLNKGDAEAFDSARVTPSTDPKTVKSNLAKQQQILYKAISRKADVLKASGYQPQAVDAALSVQAPTVDSAGPMQGRSFTQPIDMSQPTQAGALNAPPVPGATRMNTGPGARPVPTQDKVQLLRQYANNPEARAAFDEIYGAGAADHFLTGGR